jgi:hypothetical protein
MIAMLPKSSIKKSDVLVYRLLNAGRSDEEWVWFRLDGSAPKTIESGHWPFRLAILSVKNARCRFGDAAYEILHAAGLNDLELVKRYREGRGISLSELDPERRIIRRPAVVAA